MARVAISCLLLASVRALRDRPRDGDTPLGRYLDYQQEVLGRVAGTCAYKRFLLKHDAACAVDASGPPGRPAPLRRRLAAANATAQRRETEKQGETRDETRGETQRRRLAPIRRRRPGQVARGGAGDQCVRPLFVTGCGGSGTHYVQAFLAATNVRGRVEPW